MAKWMLLAGRKLCAETVDRLNRKPSIQMWVEGRVCHECFDVGHVKTSHSRPSDMNLRVAKKLIVYSRF